ncbi:MAG TPA: SCO family protein [Candidatus Binatia bacterium]
MRGRALAAIGGAIFALTLLVAVVSRAADVAATLKAGTFDPPRDAPELSLVGSDGQPLSLARFRGRVVVVEFGFTSCPNVCPTTLATIARAHTLSTAAGKDFQLVYVTVDPEHDDAARLHDYLAHFDPAFVGGTGSAEQLAALRKAYGIEATRTDTGYSHSSFTYLVDPAGKLRALMPFGSSAEDYVHDVALLWKP